MTTQKILSGLRKTVNAYAMINDGDRIAVGLSGGKDSVTLLYALSEYKKFSPQRFDLIALTVDMGIGSDFKELTDLCNEIKVEHIIINTVIGKIVFEERKEKNPCSLCANMRRGALVNTAVKHGCNKLALGHNADDLIETFFLSLFYENRLSALPPITVLPDKNLTIIRPLIRTPEKNIASYASMFSIIKNPCPAAHHTNREYMKKLLKGICKDIPSAKQSVLSAITNPQRYNLYDKYDIDKHDIYD